MTGTAIKTGGLGSRQTDHLNLVKTLVMPSRNSNGERRHFDRFRDRVPIELRDDYDVLLRHGYRAKEAQSVVLGPSPALHTLSR